MRRPGFRGAIKWHLVGAELVFFLFLALAAHGFWAPTHERLENLDRRRPETLTREQTDAVSQVQQKVPGARADFDPILASPSFIASPHGFLTGANGVGLAVTRRFSDAIPAGDPDRAAKAFLNEHAALFGHGAEVLSQARRTREFVTPHNGLRTVIWQQELEGIPVFQGLLVAHTTQRGELVSISSRFAADVRKAADAGTPGWLQVQASPPITAEEAVARAAANVGEEMNATEAKPAGVGRDQRLHYQAPVLLGDTEVRHVWLPVSRNALRLCWEVVLTSRKRSEMFRLVVDAETGEILVRHGLTEYYSDATYRVYTSDSPSPYSPACATPCTTEPPVVARDLVTLSALSSNDSPAGWIGDGQNTTVGNNVDAHLDKVADNVPDPGSRPTGNPFRVFDCSMDLTQQPVTYTNAAVVQLFYWCNWMHDKLYELGFTEATGNFQTDNFGRGGLGNDAVQADAQDGSGFNNANFSTPSDGSPGRMQMYIFNYPAPNRDGDLDAEVILHEYTHGLSNRRVGGGVGISALQSGGMGEGWSDFYAQSLLSQTSDDPNATYAYGGYVTYLLSGLTQNYYFGIRRYPYSTDMTKNPLTFKDIDPVQASAHTGVPRSPIVATTANEVHNMGEVWCVTLWEARANLIAKYGPTVGNQLMLQLVTDGMNLSPANPNFLQARDAILQADQVNTGGANKNQLWAAFAKRGMGFSATSPGSSTTTGLVEAYDLPDFLKVTPATGLDSNGAIGGPFSPASQSYTLSNTGTSALNWTAGKTAAWLDISSTTGSLSPGSSNTVVLTINATANSLSAGAYSDTVTFSNTASGATQSRVVTLTIHGPTIFLADFEDGSGGYNSDGFTYTPDPDSTSNLWHGTARRSVSPSHSQYYGLESTGNYNTGARTAGNLLSPNISLVGVTSPIILSYKYFMQTENSPSWDIATVQISTNSGITWITLGTLTDSASFTTVSSDISAYAGKKIQIRFNFDTIDGVANTYEGWYIDDVMITGTPAMPGIAVTVPTTATEGDGVLTGQGVVYLPSLPTNNVIVTLASSDTSEVTVPVSLTIPTGSTNATFNITIVDDTELDGPQTATVTASAPGYANGNASITVNDNETATLSVALPTNTIEGAGVVTGHVFASAAPTANVPVTLSSSDTTELIVPASVAIAAGQTSAVFIATVVDDAAIDGPQNATVTAHVTGWTDGSATITVLDNENFNLTVVLPAQVAEGDGVIANGGSVNISGTLSSNLVVSLVSSDTTELIVPASATILAGQTSAAFNLTVVDDAAMDGPQPATVTASAVGFNNGSATTTVLDNDPHHFTFAPIASPQMWSLPFSVTITAKDATNGTVTGFRGPVALSAAGNKGAVSITPTNSGVFTAGQWSGTVTANTLDSNVVLTASFSGSGTAPTGSSNPFDLIRPAGSFFIAATNRVDMVPDATRGLLYITEGDHVLRYDLGALKFLTSYVFSGSSLKGIDISPDDNTLVVADSAYSSTSLWVYVVNLSSGTSQKAEFPLAFSEAGSWAVAFGNDGAVLITSGFQGSGWVPLRRYNPATGDVKTVASVDQNSMVSSSGDGHTIGIAEFNSSAGPVDRYDVTSQAITGTAGTGWFNYEIGVNRDGTQFAVPTYGGTFIFGSNLTQIALLGSYASEGPVGVSYYPQGDLVFFAWWPTSYVRAYETHTMTEVARYDTGHNFGNNGNWAFVDGRVRSSRDGSSVFVTVGNGVSWIYRGLGPPADLAVTQLDSPDPVNAGGKLTYTISAANNGPNSVTDARVFDRLPAGVSFVSAIASQGSCVQSNGLVTCTIGALGGGGSVTIKIVVTPPFEAILTNTAAIVSSGADPNVTNNATTVFTTVQGVASLVVTPVTNLVATGTTGGPFTPSSQTYTLTNNGTAALSWSVTNTASWVSLSATGGSLPPSAVTTVTVSINSGANSLPASSYSDTVTFLNLSNGIGNTTNSVSLTIVSVGILEVSPDGGLASTGPRGGPFTPVNQSYALTNSGDGSLNWVASNTTTWVSLSPANGTLAPGATATLLVSINATATNLARGTYSDSVGIINVSSGQGNTTRPVTLTANTAPTATPQTVTLAEDTSVAIPLQGNDSDGDSFTAIITVLPASGTLYQTTDGTNPTSAITSVPTTVTHPSRKVIYQPALNGNGNGYGNFQFRVNDGLADSSDALVTVNVTPVNDAPVAANDSLNFLIGTPQVSFNVLLNDTDPDNDPLTVQSYTLPTRGALTQINNGLFTYWPNATFTNGQDQFSYTVNDGHGAAATAQVTIKVRTGYLNGGDWPTFGNGPSHTGYYPGILGSNTLVTSWSTNYGVNLNQVAVGVGRVFVTPVTYFGATYVSALDAATGQPAWRDDFNAAFSINPPTYDNGKVYVHRGDHASDTQLWCLNAVDGSIVWSAPHQAQWERYYAPTVYGDGIWVDGGYYGGMYGFSTNGTQRFFYSGLAQYDQWTPTYYQGTIYSWVNSSFRAHNPLTGSNLWSVALNGGSPAYSMNTVASIDQGRAFIMAGSYLHAVDLSTHSNVWSVAGSFSGSPTVVNGIVYIIAGSQVQAFSTQDGTFLGSYLTGDGGLYWQPIVTDDALLVASSSSTYIFDLASRQVIQTIPYGGTLSVANGRLYIAGQDGWLRTYLVPANSPADVAVSMVGAPNPQTIGSDIVYALMVTNLGPNSSSSVMMTDSLATNLLFASASASQGDCTQIAGVVTCTLGSMASGTVATATIVVTPTTLEAITNTAIVSAVSVDPNLANNTATTVTLGPDITAPLLTISSPADYSYTTNSTVTVVGTSSDASGVAGVTVNGVAAASANGYSNWTAVVSGLGIGTNTVMAIAVDSAVPANTSSNFLHIIYATGSFDGNSDGLPDLWQLQHFTSVSSPNAAPSADPDGDGLSNLKEYLTGTDPNNSASALRILGVTIQGSDVLITWRAGGGHTNVLQAMNGLGGVYFNISPNIVIPDAGDAVTNYLDKGGATTTPCRLYRVALGGSSIPDTSPPALTVVSPINYAYTTNASVTVTGTCVDVSGVAGVTVNGVAASSANGYSNWAAVVSGLSVGTNTFTVLAGDNAAPANIATNTVRVIYAVGDYDGNGDGLPDAWQIQHFGSVAAPGGGPNDDPDGDGLSNLKEYLAGTDPTNSGNTLRITAVEKIGGDIRVSFTSVGGKNYRLERCNVAGGSWTNVVDNISGNSGVQQATDIAGATRLTSLYRVSLIQTNSPSPLDSDGDGIPDDWTQQYFTHPMGMASDLSRAGDDKDGDGMSNLQEYLTGTDPTNSASALRIIGLALSGNDVRITWTMGTGRTNALQAATGSYNTSSFGDIFIVTNTVGTVTNYLDVGAATIGPARHYRVRLVP